MNRRLLALAAPLLLASACKGEVVTKDSPETLAALTGCQDSVKSKDDYIKQLEQRLADLELQLSQAKDEVTVTFSGNEMTISGEGPSVRQGGPVKADQELFAAFDKQVQGSRSAMQRCYQNALKRDTSLQARSITMTIDVRFTATGKVSKANFRPGISDAFVSCMNSITERWSLPGAASGISFQQPVSLSPQ